MKFNVKKRSISFSRLRRKFQIFSRKDDGAIAVEFALILPIYLMVIIMIIELARVAYVQSAVTFAAEEATRYALVHYGVPTAEVEAYASSNLLGLSSTQIVSIAFTEALNADNTRLISVSVKYQYVPILPIHKFFSDTSEFGFEVEGLSKGFLTEDLAKF